MSNKADQVLSEIENDPQAFMIIGPQKGKVLTDLIDEHRPVRILEIGTNLGYSAILIATHIPQEGKITTLELQQNSANRSHDNIAKAGLEDKITIIVGDARETIPNLQGPFDFVFIDASKKQYLSYLKLVEERLSPKAVIVADNVGRFKDEVAEYLLYVKKGGKYESQSIEVGDDALEVSLLK